MALEGSSKLSAVIEADGLFEKFLAEWRSDMRRIAALTRGEVQLEDLYGDVWLLAFEIGNRRGAALDLSVFEDQHYLIRALNVQTLRRCDWKMRRAVRLDDDSSDLAQPLIETLAADDSYDPAARLELAQLVAHGEEGRDVSYSQATAYVISFERFNFDVAELAIHLGISLGATYQRFRKSLLTVMKQNSLFDGGEKICATFIPEKGRPKRKMLRELPVAEQLTWAM